MDTLFSAILGDLTSRSLSFLIDRCTSKPLPPQPPAVSKEEKIKRMERMLLRLAATIAAAEGRRITNHAMLRQVNILRQDMHKGYYLLDTFRIQKAHEEKVMNKDNNEVSYSLALPKFNSTKRARVPSSSRQHGDREELDEMVDNLEITMNDMVEFVLLLNNYPSMQRQPYNTYLFMDKCMFGRQMEMEYVINFLLQPEPPNTPNVDHNLGVLPIIGPAKVGKSTLVEHVCYDERVLNHFSRIIFLTDNDFIEEKSLLTLQDSGVIRHKYSSSSSASSGEERLLVIVELTGDVADDEWRRMYSSSRSCISAGSKIIITSQSEKIAKLGTTQPLHLKFLSQEAYWYFFKVLAFGSSDPEEHPEVASLAMAMFNGYFDLELYKSFIGPFIDLSIMASCIQASVYDGSWLSSLRDCSRDKETKSHFLHNRGSGDCRVQSKCVFIPKTNGTVHHYCEIYSHCRVAHAREEEEAPRIDMQDLFSRRVAPNGKFDLVLWRSHLPPYYSYIYSSEIHEYRPPIFRMGLGQKRKI